MKQDISKQAMELIKVYNCNDCNAMFEVSGESEETSCPECGSCDIILEAIQ